MTDRKLRSYPFEPFAGELPAEVLRMVHDEPVSRVMLPHGQPAWLVLGYDEVRTVLADARFSRRADEVGRSTADACPVVRDLADDTPERAGLRRLAGRAFSPRRIEAYRPRVQQLTDELLAAMRSGPNPADLVAALVAPLPILTICELLGVAVRDRDRFTAWTTDIFSVTGYGSIAADTAVVQLRAYLAERLEAKRAEPGDDLISAWLAIQRDESLLDEEIVGLAMAVLFGGRETNSISAGLRALFMHPEHMAALRADPTLMPSAIEEILRYTSVSAMFLVQHLTDDVELGGVQMRAGEAVMAVPWAANRQADRFPAPDTFNPQRTHNPHLAFGYGTHFCLGAALGRLELEVALGTLLRDFPTLAPAVPLHELPWREERISCGIAEFPVTW